MTTTQNLRTTGAGRTLATTAAGLALAVAASLGTAAQATAAPPGAQPTTATTTAAAQAPSAAPTHAPEGNLFLVEAWYATFLGRDSARDPGSGYWTRRLDSGVPAEVVLGELLRTREHATSAVTTIYRAYLDRRPDPGASYWIDAVVRGDLTLEAVEQEVGGSDELLLRSSGDGCVGDCGPFPGPVPTWYRVVLDRAPSPGEVAYWEGRLGERGATSTFRELWYTPEAIAARVQGHYTGLLGRRASAGEIAYWYDQERAGDAAVLALVASSREFLSRFAA